MIHPLMRTDIQTFIRDNTGQDVKALALGRMPGDWPRTLILDQIAARQKAMRKTPDWINIADIIFPSPNLMEQCSSHATALFKSSLVSGNSFVDLTAGAGVDTVALSRNFKSGFAVEADEHAATCLRHNLPLLGAGLVGVIQGTAEDFIATMKETDCVFIDPQRRTSGKRGLMRLEDTVPNILTLLPDLKQKSKTILLKTSPVLDIDLGIQQLAFVSAVHVLEHGGDAKEILFIMTPENYPAPDMVPVSAHKLNDDGVPTITLSAPRQAENNTDCPLSDPLRYLYEPGPAFMKAGLFRTITQKYNVKKLHPSTHLYTSEQPVNHFPGRIFEIDSILPVDKKAVPAKANLAIRNFPGSVEDLKKKLGIRDGGDIYLFACTFQDGRKHLLSCRKT